MGSVQRTCISSAEKKGDPQLLDENSSLRYIDDLRKDIETDVRQTYGNSSFGAYDPNSQPPEREEIAKQQFSREEVQNGLYVQHVTALANEIDKVAEGMELPLFMRMVQAYHLTYAAETLGADKEKKAAFARSTYNIELGHKPVEDALYKSAVSKSKSVSEDLQ